MKQAKKNYKSPEILVTNFDYFDVLTTSGITPPSYDEGEWDVNDD